MRPAFALLVLVITVVAGCSGDDDPETSATTAGDATADTAGSTTAEDADPIGPYFDALASATGTDQMLEWAAPDSPAELYATLLGSQKLSAQTIETTADDELELCFTTNPDQCVTFGGFEVDDGELVSFTVDGEPLDDRIVASGESAAGDPGLTITVPLVYWTASDDLAVLLEIANGDAGDLDLRGGVTLTYTAPDGDEVELDHVDGPVALEAGETDRAVAYFTGAEPGGTLHWASGATSLDLPIAAP